MDIRPVLEVISEDMTNGQDRLYSAWPVGHNDRCCDVKILDADCVQLSTNVVTSEYVMRSVRVVRSVIPFVGITAKLRSYKGCH